MRSTFFVPTVLAVLAMTWATFAFVRLRDGGTWGQVSYLTVCWVVAAIAYLLLRRVPRRAVSALVLAGGLLAGTAALAAPPSTSNDAARYAWDGIVQKAGVSPYQFVPRADQLAELRPDWLFTEGTLKDERVACPDDYFPTPDVGTRAEPSGDPLCTTINRPQVPTIYPAVAEMYFLLVRALPGSEAGFLPFQVAGLVLSMAVSWLLLRALRRHRLPLHYAALWAWSPLVTIEAINNSHVDLLAGGLMLVSTLLLVEDGTPIKDSVESVRQNGNVARGRVTSSGIAFGAAVATKLVPVIAAPALLFRKPVRFVLISVGTFALLYLPYVLLSGWSVIGFLPGYLSEEGYGSESNIRFALARLVVPDSWAIWVSAAFLAVLAVVVLKRVDPRRPWDAQTVIVGMTLLVVSPSYPWYALLLAPFVALSGRSEYLTIPAALSLIYLTSVLPNAVLLARVALLVSLAAILVAAYLRMRTRTGPTPANAF